MLEIKNINKNFGGLRAVNNASMNIEKGVRPLVSMMRI